MIYEYLLISPVVQPPDDSIWSVLGIVDESYDDSYVTLYITVLQRGFLKYYPFHIILFYTYLLVLREQALSRLNHDNQNDVS